MIIEEPISTNGTNISGCIRATYYKNGERNIAENVINGMGYEGVVEPQSCAIRGRYINEDRDTEQQLELEFDECANCLISVEKDSMIMEKEMVGIKQATKKGYIECEVGGLADLSYPDSKTRRGRVENQGQISPTLTASNSGICKIEKAENMEELQGVNTENDGTSRTIKAQYYKTSGANFLRTGDMGATGVAKIDACQHYRIRKLTPKECFRLMDFSDEDFKKAEAVNSNTKLYAQAGNSIVCNVLVALFGQMFEGKEDIYKQIDNKFNNEDTKEMDECGDYLHHIQNNIYKEDTVNIKKEIFKSILDKFETEELRAYCEDMIEEMDTRMLQIPSSTSLKYHNATQCQDGGAAYHVLMVCTIGNYLLDLKYIKEKFQQPKKRDCMRIALLFHDNCKTNGGKYTVHEHPLLAAEWIKKTKVEHDIKQGLKDYIADLIIRHSGEWTSSNRSSVVLPEIENDEQFFCHMCDILGSRSNLDMIYTEKQIGAIKKLTSN